jgi:ArsR family transcriptional regulator
MYVDAAALLRLLGDSTRLRLLRLLSIESLNVSELTAVLSVAQSGVSRHLGLLRDAGLVTEERSGTFSWYRLSESFSGNGAGSGLHDWLAAEFTKPTNATRADDARLEEVRRLRKDSFQIHGDEKRQLVPGRSWPAWARALGLLLPPMDVADLGCGDGYLTIEAARWARHVTAIDRSADVLARGRDLAKRRKLTNITWKRGELERVPIKGATMDLVLLSQALHHAERPDRAIAEAHRIVRPGGRVLILELREHEEAWVRTTLGDRWQGFTEAQLRGLLQGAGFNDPIVKLGARRSADPFAVLIATGTKGVHAAGGLQAAGRAAG